MLSRFMLLILACLLGCGGGAAPVAPCESGCTTLTPTMFAGGSIFLTNLGPVSFTNTSPDPVQVTVTCSADLLLTQDATVSTEGIGWLFGLEISPDQATWTGVDTNHTQFGTSYAAGLKVSDQPAVFTFATTVPAGGTLYARLQSQLFQELGGPGQFSSGTLTVTGSIQIAP